MKVIMLANAEQRQEIGLKTTGPGVELAFVKSLSDVETAGAFDALFCLSEHDGDAGIARFEEKPVFINSVIETLAQKKLPVNFSRINGWPGFLRRKTWEIASLNKPIAAEVFERLHWNFIFVKDEPGLVAARVISMIINEAFFALQENVSTTDEIDLAMKLGTNYPYGPFEWQNKVGIENIYRLLKVLSVKDKRYSVSPLLEKKFFELVPV